MLPLLVAAAWWGSLRPSLTRPWVPEQARTPGVRILPDEVHVRHVRDFRFLPGGAVEPGYHERRYRLDELERVWFVVSPFGRAWRGPAHTFLSFGFRDGTYVSVSVEARREQGETYSVWRGMLRQYELAYVIAEERDAIGMRAVAFDVPVHLYPIRATPEQARAVFLRMMQRAEALEREPAFYHTLTDNCTTNILDAVNAVADPPIGYGWRILVPGYTDAVAHERGLLDTELPLSEARERFRVNDRARAAADAPDFSARIRGG